MGKITIAVNQNTKLRLMKRMKYGDSFDSALNEMLDTIDAQHPKDVPQNNEHPIKDNTSVEIMEVKNDSETISQ